MTSTWPGPWRQLLGRPLAIKLLLPHQGELAAPHQTILGVMQPPRSVPKLISVGDVGHLSPVRIGHLSGQTPLLSRQIMDSFRWNPF
eukprot:scaffold6684_cov20-Prasinocladus_malaysianus.AAC.2